MLRLKTSHTLYLYLCILPVYILSNSIVLLLSDSIIITRLIQAWKEVIGIITLFICLARVRFPLNAPRMHIIDLLAFLFLIINLFGVIIPSDTELQVRLHGFRANCLFLLPYILGRLTPLDGRSCHTVLLTLVIVGTLAGLFVLVELLVLPSDWPARVGVMKYMDALYGIKPVGHYGLTWTFETATGLRRRSAFFANPLELASSVLVTGPAVLALIFGPAWVQPRKKRFLLYLSSVLILLSLILSVSRASLLAAIFQILVLALVLRIWWLLGGVMWLGIFGALSLFFFAPDELRDFVWQSVTFHNPSSAGHVSEWFKALTSIIANPWGLGLGTSGHIGSRFAQQVGGENQFLILGVQLGLVGLLSYTFLLILVIYYCMKAYRATRGTISVLCLVAAVARLGLLIPAFTSQVDLYLFVTFTTWWLVGFSIQQLVHISARRADMAECIL